MAFLNSTSGISLQSPESNFVLDPSSQGFPSSFLRLFMSIPHKFTNGESFQGKLAAGKPNGRGTYFFTNGDKLEGEFFNGVFKGEINYHFSNGGKYIGECLEGIAHGKGQFVFKNQMAIVGQFQEGLPVGKCKILQSYQRKGFYLVTFDENGSFEGVFYNKVGKTDNSKFTGNFENGTLTLHGAIKRGLS